jgi:hypothetical protein
MIDTQLIAKSKKCSQALMASDVSWREYVEEIKRNAFHLPFEGNYALVIKEKHLWIEGYAGEIRIDRLYFGHKTYVLKSPIRHTPFRIYGIFDNLARFKCYTAEPLIGFHYLGLMGDDVRPICTGEAQCEEPKSFETLKHEALRITQVFRLINTESLGEIFLPPGYERFKEILSNKEEDLKITVKKLIEEELIEKLL